MNDALGAEWEMLKLADALNRAATLLHRYQLPPAGDGTAEDLEAAVLRARDSAEVVLRYLRGVRQAGTPWDALQDVGPHDDDWPAGPPSWRRGDPGG